MTRQYIINNHKLKKIKYKASCIKKYNLYIFYQKNKYKESQLLIK